VRIGRTLHVAAGIVAVATLGCSADSNNAAVDSVDVSETVGDAVNEEGNMPENSEIGVEGPRGATHRIEYGANAANYGELTLPDGEGPVPVVVLIHGGFWRSGFDLDLMRPLVPSLVDAGFAVWNIEYRTVGAGGGYPETFDDVAAAIDHLATISDPFGSRLDLGRVATVGHSAGGHLAVWAASRASVPPGMPGAIPAVRPMLAVSQAGVLDLVGCIAAGTGGTACSDLLGATPDSDTELFEYTSPIQMLPIEASVVLVHGTADSNVPIAQSTGYLAAADQAGTVTEMKQFEGADHFDVIDPNHESWAAVLDAVAHLGATPT
jgi:acetyl esterase/lipase